MSVDKSGIVKMPAIALPIRKPGCAHKAAMGRQGARRRLAVRSTFSAARHHLEEAHRLLAGEDELSAKSRQALEILIDAFLASEYAEGRDDGKVIDFLRHRAGGR